MSETIEIPHVARLVVHPALLDDDSPLGELARRAVDASLTAVDATNKLRQAVAELTAARNADRIAAQSAIREGKEPPAATESKKITAVGPLARNAAAAREVAAQLELELSTALAGDQGTQWQQRQQVIAEAAANKARTVLEQVVDALADVDAAGHALRWLASVDRDVSLGYGLPTTLPGDGATEYQMPGYPTPALHIAQLISQSLPGAPEPTPAPVVERDPMETATDLDLIKSGAMYG